MLIVPVITCFKYAISCYVRVVEDHKLDTRERMNLNGKRTKTLFFTKLSTAL